MFCCPRSAVGSHFCRKAPWIRHFLDGCVQSLISQPILIAAVLLIATNSAFKAPPRAFGRVELLFCFGDRSRTTVLSVTLCPSALPRVRRHCALTAAVVCAHPLTSCVFAQNHLPVSTGAHPLAPSLGSSVASSAGSGSSSPAALPSAPRTHPPEPTPGRSKTSLAPPRLFFALTLCLFRTRCTRVSVTCHLAVLPMT